MTTINRDGAEIYFEEVNPTGQRVVTLVNGHTRSSSDFRMMARILGEAGFRVVSLDNRGAGKTKVNRAFSIEDLCSDVVALWDELGVGTSSLLGISMGGFISQGIAIQYPDRMDKLILVSTAPEEKFINPSGGGWINEGTKLEEKMRTYFAPGFVERNPVLFKTMVTQIRQAIDSSDFTARSDMQRAALRGAGWTHELHRIKSPTLIIHGKEDRVIDIEAAKKLNEAIANSQLAIIPPAGHLLLAEAPKELYRIVQEFLVK
jgi:3-oxoadipate enol-lactonase